MFSFSELIDRAEKLAANDNANAFAQMDKNTVRAKNQLNDTPCVRFENPNGSGPRILFVGNSITLHGVKADIGWNAEWGMAASEKEKDYVHLLMESVKRTAPDACFCICQVAEWERAYKEGETKFPLYEAARSFAADILIMRCVENCPKADMDTDLLAQKYDALIEHLKGSDAAQVIVTTGFWHHPGDEALCRVATDRYKPLIPLGDLGDDDAMKAIGLFEHMGVANHPGDLGMKAIADRIFEKLFPMLDAFDGRKA